MSENEQKNLKIRFKFSGGEEFEAEGNAAFIEEQRNYFLKLIGKTKTEDKFSTKKIGTVSIHTKEDTAPFTDFLKKDSLPTPELITQYPQKITENNAHYLKGEAQSKSESSTQSLDSTPAHLWDILIKTEGDLVLLRRKPRISAQEGVLLLLAGAKSLLNKTSYSALLLSKAMKKSGFSEGRLDRLLSHELKENYLEIEGNKRGRVYKLTASGFTKAYVLANKLYKDWL